MAKDELHPANGRQTGEAFAQALGARDFEALAKWFHTDVRGRLLTPSALAMPLGRAALVNKFRGWFGEVERLELVSASCDQLGARVAIGYRLRVRESGHWYVVAQQTYSRLEQGLIAHFDLLCSGFQPESSDCVERGAV